MPPKSQQIEDWKADLFDDISPPEEVADTYPKDTFKKYQAWKKKWKDDLNPTQNVIIDDQTSKWMLLHGERGTGKTWVGVFKGVEHGYLEPLARIVIVTQTTGQAREGGAWDILTLKVLPLWKARMGLEYTFPQYDPLNRKPYIWIRCRTGSWVKVICTSLPVDANISDRVKGMEASYALVDEAQNFRTHELFKALSQQVGRVVGVKRRQQLVFCCNPDGPSHPLYKRFWLYPVNIETGEWNNAYAKYHLGRNENQRNLPEDYYDYVKEAVRGDPIEHARMLEGVWVDRPRGRSIFGAFWNRELHLRGDANAGTGLLPHPGIPLRVGYDLGPAHSSVHFLQLIKTKDGKSVWVVFDEVNTVGQHVPYRRLAKMIINRMDYWESVLRAETGNDKLVVPWDHISDNSAFNAVRGDGSFDVMTFETETKGRIKLRAAPKGAGSVQERIRLLTDKLLCEEIMVSALCPKTVEMIMDMRARGKSSRFDDGEVEPPTSPAVGDPLKHVFDSLTYPMITLESNSYTRTDRVPRPDDIRLTMRRL